MFLKQSSSKPQFETQLCPECEGEGVVMLERSDWPEADVCSCYGESVIKPGIPGRLDLRQAYQVDKR